MATSYECLAQLVPATGGAYENLYTVPASTQIVISALHVANNTGADDTFFVRLKVAGAADDDKQVLYSSQVQAGDAMPVMAGYCLNATDELEVASTNGAVAFNLFGAKLT